MKVFITGINGFIGQKLAESLIKRGHSVIGLGKNGTCLVKNVENYFSGDILNKELVHAAIADSDIVAHLAALTAHEDIVNNKEQTEETNLIGTKNVIEAFLKSKAQKFIYPSTGKVYGDIKYLPIDENHPTNPLNILGKSKLQVEKLIRSYESHNKNFTIFRIFNVYGKNQKENFLIPTILKQLSGDKKEITLGDIHAKRDYVYVDEVVDAFVLAIEKKSEAGVSIYNICTGKGTSAEEIVQEIGTIKNKEINIIQNKSLYRNDESAEEYGSYEKIEKELGWKPTISLREGLEKLIS